MVNDRSASAERDRKRFDWIRAYAADVPLLAWMLGVLAAVLLELAAGDFLANLVGLPKVPVLFGCIIMLKEPTLIPGAMAFFLLIYAAPILLLGKLDRRSDDGLADRDPGHYPSPAALCHHVFLVGCQPLSHAHAAADPDRRNADP